MYFSQKFLIRVGAAVLAFGLAQTAFVPVASAQGIFTFKGKSYNRGDLPIAEQNNLFEAEEENFTRVQGIVDNTLISMHVAELAAKSGKSTAAVEEELFKVAEPTDKDAKDWYEANKARIPYPFDKIQNDVKQLLKGEKQREKRTQLVDKLKKDGGFTMHVARPTAPSVQVAFEGHPMKGNATAKVTIVEFADYQCPHCKAAAEAMKKVFDKYKDKIRFYFIDFPINPSGISTKVAEAAYCAKAQNKYWEFHEKAYEQ
jgi:thiol-disulfide isomerase/thioredoxin